jgi:hypothetical protein
MDLKRAFMSCLFLFYMLHSLSAQKIIGIGTKYNNSFREWIITTDDEDVKGELIMRWAFQNDWTEWDVRVGDISATIEQKWKDDENLWEIRCEGRTVNARTAWPGEFYRWKLSDGSNQYNWLTPYANKRDEWSSEKSEGPFFQIYTYWDGDPREWVIVDELPEDVSMAMKLAMIFLALHFSTPRA